MTGGEGAGACRAAVPAVAPGVFAINGPAFDMRRVDERVRLGDTEIWAFSGDMMAHPIHLHGVHFQVLRTAPADRRRYATRACATR